MSSELALNTLMAHGSRWKRYPAYRDSGVEWLGEVPEGWKLKRIKQIASKIGSGKTPKGGSEVYSESGVTFLRSQNIHFDGLHLDDVVFITESIDKEMSSTRVFSNDVLLNITGASLGRCSLVPDDFLPANVNQHVCIIRPIKKSIAPLFLYNVFASKVVQALIFSLENGTSREGLTFSQIANLIIFAPDDLEEQYSIAAFLDRETGRIDTLIEKKERQIELLQEKRAALISHTVTKGLDPDVKMNDSGVEWLGEVPEHWEVTPLRGVLKQRGEYNIGPRTTNILSVVKDVGVINYDERVASGNKKSDNVEQYKIIHKGDIVVNRMNVIIGSVGVANEFGAASIEYYVLYAKDSSVYTEYYGQIFRSKMFQKNLGRLGSGILGHRLRIPFEVLKSEMLPKPPYSEQHNIANALNDERKRIDNLTTKVRESISKISEYRSALISAAVTGKIDVRPEVA